MKCAIGVLISDEFYDPSFEGESVNNWQVSCALKKSGVSERLLNKPNSWFLADLQGIHDGICPRILGEVS